MKLNTEEEIQKYIKESELRIQAEQEKNTYAAWAFESNITEETKEASLEAQGDYNVLYKEIGLLVQKIDLSKVKDNVLRRKIKLLSNLGTSALPLKKLKAFNKLKAEMGSTYSKAKVKEFSEQEKDYSLEPELTHEMAHNRDPEMLEYYWTSWRDKSGIF